MGTEGVFSKDPSCGCVLSGSSRTRLKCGYDNYVGGLEITWEHPADDKFYQLKH